ncbi:MAG: kinase-like domain-containing protein [Linnemannia gamsii]|nr:MAG: kinase-like domain-containing protein [Linnemannia gamsii]
MPERITDTARRKTYTLLTALGEGGQGTCFSAACKTMKMKKTELVALKVILCNSPEKKAMAEKEVEIQQSIEHRNMARLLRKFRVQNLTILVLELCSTDLGKMLRQRQKSSTWMSFDEGEIRPHLRSVLEALCHLHSLKIVHRDIKPSNIFIGSEGEVKVGDFGMAFVDDEGDVERPSCGTEGYKAKELQTGGVYHNKVDIFAFGATMCKMLTGHTHPDASSTIIGVDVLSDEALEVVVAALEEEPGDRPTAEELLKFDFFTPQVKHKKKKVRLSSPSSCPPPAASSSSSSSGHKHKVVANPKELQGEAFELTKEPQDVPLATSAVEPDTAAAAPPVAPAATNDQSRLSHTDVAVATNVATVSFLSSESPGPVSAGAIGSAAGVATDAVADAASEDIQAP